MRFLNVPNEIARDCLVNNLNINNCHICGKPIRVETDESSECICMDCWGEIRDIGN